MRPAVPVLVLHALWLWCFVCVRAQDLDNGTPFANPRCQFEELPSDLDGPAHLGNIRNTLHEQGEFFANFSSGRHHDVRFALKQNSLLRVYVAPHAVDVDLWLYEDGNFFSIAHSSLAVGTEEVLVANLTANSNYTIRFLFFGAYYGGYTAGECDTLHVEWAIEPVSRAAARLAAWGACPAGDTLPAAFQSKLSNIAADTTTVSYNSDTDEALGRRLAVGRTIPSAGTRWVASYNFTLPTLSKDTARNQYWRLDAELGIDFLSGGSLGLLLLERNTGDPALSLSLNCISQGRCSVASGYSMNSLHLAAAVQPGDFSLWLYDQTNEQVPLGSCSPFTLNFSLSQASQPEDFLNCAAHALPSTLMPGLLEHPDGSLHWRESVLVDLGEREHQMSFEITGDSWFRARTSPHRIDIDLKVSDAEGNVLAYGYNWGDEEAISVFLPRGTAGSSDRFILSVIFFGSNSPQFCETFDIEVAVAPVSSFPDPAQDWCASPSSVLPDLTALTDLAISPSLKLPQHSYRFAYGGDFSQREILRQDFTLAAGSTDVYFRVLMRDDFLLGDLDLTLIDLATGGIFFADDTQRNTHTLALQLSPGSNYSLVLSTGASQARSLPHFPQCADFSLAVEVAPRDDNSGPSASGGPCWMHTGAEIHRMPSSLNAVGLLDRRGEMHFTADILVPFSTASQTYATENTTFVVQQQSLFRVWAEAHHVDVDFILFEGRNPVISVTQFNVEEELLYELKVGQQYRLETKYYHWSHPDAHSSDPSCFVYSIEMAVAPVANRNATHLPGTCTGGDSVPSELLIGSVSKNSGWSHDSVYWFEQSSSSRQFRLPFTIEQGASLMFRAVITYNFVWSDFSLELNIPGSDNSTLSNVAVGVNEFNRNDLQTILLGPGSYELSIYEPASSVLPTLRGCAAFSLRLAFGSASVSTVGGNQDEEVLGCWRAPKLPATFNTLSWLSPLTEQRMHIQERVLADIEARRMRTLFSVQSESIFRAYVPLTDELDVDIVLRQGGVQVASSLGFEDESIGVVLQPSTMYELEIRFYAFYGRPLPRADSCPTFPFELSIVPVSALSAFALTSCANTAPAGYSVLPNINWALELDRRVAWPIRRNATDMSVRRLSLSLSRPSTLDVDFEYDFATGGVIVDLSGIALHGSTRTQVRFHAAAGQNHAFLHRSLPAGDYLISIQSVFTTPTPVLCSDLSISYLVNSTALVGEDWCDDTQRLPTDLFSPAGGSDQYGGPQDLSPSGRGSVRIFGEQIYIDYDDSMSWSDRNHDILFRTTSEDVYMRAFARGPTARDDLDFYIYDNPNRTGAPIFSSIGIDSYESALWRIPQRQTSEIPYDLDVMVWSLDPTTAACPRFHFETAIRPVSVVHNELSCPQVMPSPEVPPGSFVASNSVFNFGEYVFSRSRIDANMDSSGTFSYPISLTAFAGTGNLSIYASVMFDFLSNDLRLSLVDSATHRVIARGEPSGTSARDGYFNFYNLLTAELVDDSSRALGSALYELRIEETHVGARDHFGLSDYCHRFSFFLAAFVDSPLAPPEIDWVLPFGGEDVNYLQDLHMSVAFSQPVSNASATLAFFTSASAVVLRNNAVISKPSSITWNLRSDVLEVTFARSLLQKGQVYDVLIDASLFRSAAGNLPFSARQSVFTFRMSPCLCSNHGQCDESGRRPACVCDPGYSGNDCESCAPGYHGSGTSCAADIQCGTPAEGRTFCNNHGSCVDSSGMPHCTCDDGYATTDAANNNWCAACAPGFEKMTEGSSWTCQPVSDAFTRGSLCNAPLLPKSLNSPAFLGRTGSMHLRGEYFADIQHLAHDTSFDLEADSVLRIYVAPHWLDVDLWLYSVTGEGEKETIAYGISIGAEESLFYQLRGGTSNRPMRYELRFRYFVWDQAQLASAGDCTTFDLEWSIEPVRHIGAYRSLMQSDCQQVSSTPPRPAGLQWPAPSSDPKASGLTPFLIPVASPTWNFLELDGVNLKKYKVDATDGKFAWGFPFEIQPPAGKVAVFYAEISYEFITGDLALLVEGESVDGSLPMDHCGRNAGSDLGRCLTGSGGYNRNKVRRELSPGKYVLWLYQPVAQSLNSSVFPTCSVYAFQMSVSYIDAETSVFYCEDDDVTMLPSSLNLPGLLGDVRQGGTGELHLRTAFLVDGASVDSRTSFTLNDAAGSALRLHASAVSGTGAAGSYSHFVSVSLYNESVGVDPNNQIVAQSLFSDEAELFVGSLPPGIYSLRFSVFQFSDSRCPTIALELAISRLAATPLVARGSCPGLVEILPPFQSAGLDGSVLTLPWHASPSLLSKTWVTYGNAHVVAQWTFVVDETAVVQADADNDFLTGAIRWELTSRTSSSTMNDVLSIGSHALNRNSVRKIVQPGLVTLKLTVPTKLSGEVFPRPAAFPSCIPFEIPNFSIIPYVASNISTSDCVNSYVELERISGDVMEELPTSFGSERFLGRWKSRFDWTSRHVRVPSIRFYDFHDIMLGPVSQESTFRLWVAPHAVDIDISLHNAMTGAQLANGGYGFNNAEEIVYTLLPGSNYSVRLTFWRWETDIPPCVTFHLEVAVAPTSKLPPAATCITAWPSGIPSSAPLVLPYTYDSVLAGQDLKYRQASVADAPLSSPPINFTLRSTQSSGVFTGTSKLFVRLSRDFLRADIGLVLRHISSSDEWASESAPDGAAVLRVTGLEDGQYQIVLREYTKPVASIAGCAQFALLFEVEVDSGASGDASLDYLHVPATLNAPGLGSYFAGKGIIHLQDTYTMFEEGFALEEENVLFDVPLGGAVFRAATSHQEANTNAVFLKLQQGDTVKAFSRESILEYLDPGQYNLTLARPTSSSGSLGLLRINLQLALISVVQMDSELSAIPNAASCTDSIIPTAISTKNGFFSWRSNPFISLSYSTLTNKEVVKQMNISLDRLSSLHAVVESPFIWADLELVVIPNSLSLTTVNGRNGRNLNSLDALLPAGNYTLQFRQPLKWRDYISLKLQHSRWCSDWSVALMVQDARDGSSHVDCSEFGVVPFDLNTLEGGSARWGGPLRSDSGSLGLDGTFLMPLTGSADVIDVNVSSKSIISVATRDSFDGSAVSVQPWTVVRQTSMTSTPVNVVSFVANNYEQSTIYILDGPSGDSQVSEYALLLRYPDSATASGSTASCPRFDMQVLIGQHAHIAGLVRCDMTKPFAIPNKQPSVSSSGYSESVVSAFSATTVQQYLVNGEFVYDISLTVPSTSQLSASLGFTALANLFDVRLLSSNDVELKRASWSVPLHGRSYDGASSEVNRVLVLDHQLISGQRYKLRISEPATLASGSGLGFSGPQSLCWPFVWDLQVRPSGIPYVSRVSPSGGAFLPPSNGLRLSVILSTAAYIDGRAVGISSSSNIAAVARSFSLTGVDGVAVLCSTAASAENDGVHWELTFAPGPNSGFVASSRFQLALDGSLKDSSGASIQLFGSHIYRTIDTTCSNGQGLYDSAAGACFCQKAYAGPECAFCAVGFQNINTNPSEPAKCVPDATTTTTNSPSTSSSSSSSGGPTGSSPPSVDSASASSAGGSAIGWIIIITIASIMIVAVFVFLAWRKYRQSRRYNRLSNDVFSIQDDDDEDMTSMVELES